MIPVPSVFSLEQWRWPLDTPMCTTSNSSARELSLGMTINHHSGILQYVKKNFLDTNSFPFYDEITHFHNQEKD